MKRREMRAWLREYNEWLARYQAIPRSNTLACLNAVAYAGEQLAPMLARALEAALDNIDALGYQLATGEYYDEVEG